MKCWCSVMKCCATLNEDFFYEVLLYKALSSHWVVSCSGGTSLWMSFVMEHWSGSRLLLSSVMKIILESVQVVLACLLLGSVECYIMSSSIYGLVKWVLIGFCHAAVMVNFFMNLFCFDTGGCFLWSGCCLWTGWCSERSSGSLFCCALSRYIYLTQ